MNGGAPTIVNKPTVSGSPSSTSVSIPAPAGNDSFTFTAWDEVNGTGNILDQATTSQDILANENNSLSVVLDGVCAALVPTLNASSIYAETNSITTPLTSGTRTILKSARLVGQVTQSFAFTPVDADGNTILTTAGTVPISVTESGPTPHVTIAASTSSTSNTVFNVTPFAAEPDGFSTQLTASSPNCGSGSTTLPNSFALSTSAAMYVGDIITNGVYAFDQDGKQIALLATFPTPPYAVAYNTKSNYIVAITGSQSNGLFAFETLSPTGSVLGSGTFTPSGYKPNNSTNPPYEENPQPTSAAYNPVNGLFAVGIGIGQVSGSNLVNGNIVNVAISGSTATPENSVFSGLEQPESITILSNGNVAVNDYYEHGVYEFTQNGTSVGSVSVTPPSYVFDLTFDSLRGNLLASYLDNTQNSTTYPGAILSTNPSLSFDQTFTVPMETNGIASAVAYNPGTDELYFFYAQEGDEAQAGLVTKFPASAVYSGGTSTSDLPYGAFASLEQPTSVTVVP